MSLESKCIKKILKKRPPIMADKIDEEKPIDISQFNPQSVQQLRGDESLQITLHRQPPPTFLSNDEWDTIVLGVGDTTIHSDTQLETPGLPPPEIQTDGIDDLMEDQEITEDQTTPTKGAHPEKEDKPQGVRALRSTSKTLQIPHSSSAKTGDLSLKQKVTGNKRKGKSTSSEVKNQGSQRSLFDIKSSL